MRQVLSILTVLLPTFLLPAAVAQPASWGASSALLSDCQLLDVPSPARCGTFDVAENPQRPNGRHLNIRVAVLPARHSPAQRDPVVFFSGGPGESAIAAASDVGLDLAREFADRDVVLIDQRGTGQSSKLSCPLFHTDDPAATLAHLYPPRAVSQCLQQLQGGADLTQYSFLRFADDVELVRTKLGYGQLNLYTLSYGTRAAQVFMRAHPDSVRTAYLGSVVPIDITTPLPFARVGQDALDMTIAACGHDAACSAAFPRLVEETKTIFAKLKRGEITVAVPGQSTPVPLSAGRIAERLRSMLYKPESAATVPWTIHQAYKGDWSPFVDGILNAAQHAEEGFSEAVFFSISCAEDVRFIKEQDVRAATESTYLSEYRVREQQVACSQWPKASLPAAYRTPIRSNIPTLLVSGDADPATPAAFAQRVAAGLPNSVQLLLRGQAHSGWSDCAERAYSELIRSGSSAKIDTACSETPRPRFKIGT